MEHSKVHWSRQCTKPIPLGLYQPAELTGQRETYQEITQEEKKERPPKSIKTSISSKRCYPDNRVENAFHGQKYVSEKRTGMRDTG